MTGALLCLDITVSAGNVTFATGTSPTLAISGSLSWPAQPTWNSTATITFNATTTGKTVNTYATSIAGPVVFNGVGGAWTLGDQLIIANTLTVTAGTFNTSASNYQVVCTTFSCSGTSTRTVTLNGSDFTCYGASSTAFNAATITNLTFNSGTSQIILSGATSGISSGGLTFYNVAFTSTTAGTKTITGANTFNNFAVTAPSSAGVTSVTFDSKQTINGTLSTTGTAGNRRVFFASATYGISVDLAVNATPSLTDADFRGLYVTGTASPISGTRIGNRGECSGITFDTPKTVYWNQAAGGNWSGNNWASGAGVAPSTDYFPLAQDTATFVNTGLNTSATVTWDNVITYTGSVDMSGRTNAMTLATGTVTPTVYGSWTNGSGTTLSGTGAITFSGGSTQTITSAGKTFTQPITVNTYGGTVQLGYALDIGSNTLTVTNGTFDTKNFDVTANAFSSNNSNVRTITLGSSTINLGSINHITFTTSTNLTFNAGTSTINASVSGAGTATFNGGGQTFYNYSFTNISSGTLTLSFAGQNTFNNVTFANSSASANIQLFQFSANQTINGTLTCAGASAVRRIFLQSSTTGTQRTLTVNSISATDCDFRDINLAGAATGASPTRAGDCGGNSGITFPAAKTVYWNLAGTQNWSATGWATSSGGAPAVNNFPLAQDTAVFDNTGAAGTVTTDAAWNIGTLNFSARTSAMTFTTTTSPSIYGSFSNGTGVTWGTSSGLDFRGSGSNTITSNGADIAAPIRIDKVTGTITLADALSGSANSLTLVTGTFDAATYNVTRLNFSNSATTNTLKMGSGTWTLSGIATVWSCSTAPTLIVGTSTIVLSNTTTTARTFNGGSLYYNKLTIGGTTGTSTLTITGTNTFSELASTKTVAHTITFPSSTTTTIGKWSVTGTAGNVVTLAPSTAATTYTISIAGPANSGIDYLSVSYCAVSTTSPGEFYVGVNSTNTAGNTGAIIFTATPAARTLYWVGGTGNWSATTSWSTSSGGASGAAIPTSLDAVNFNSASNATAYTATIDAGVTIARCAAFTMAGPATGNVTFAGTVPIAFHGNVSFAATGITRSYTGDMYWAGNSSYTFDANGVSFSSNGIIIGVNSTWTLARDIIFGGATKDLTVTFGTFTTSISNYSVQVGTITSSNSNVRVINFNGSAITLAVTGSANVLNFTTTTNLSFNAGTSTISSGATAPTFIGGSQTFYNVSFTSAAATSISISGANTFNNLTFTGRTTVGINAVTFSANQTISGTLTLGAGTAAAYRTFLASDTIGTTRTLTVNALAAGAADIDFRDITIAGAAAPISGTRFGDCKGNSGITFPAAKTVYYRQTGSADWGTTGTGSWSATSGAAADATQFPLAQDTAVFPAATYPASGSTTTINANYNIGTIDMSLRTANTMTLATSANTPTIYGNWINGTGVTVTGTGRLPFAGRATQTITSAGKSLGFGLLINSPGGSVVLQDALTTTTTSYGIDMLAGEFNSAGYNYTGSWFGSTGTASKTVNFGSGSLWALSQFGTFIVSGTSPTITGTGTFSFTSASAKTFQAGSTNYSGVTLDQNGAGTLTISGNNTFKDITNTYSATGAATISLGATTTTLTQFTGTGAAAKLLTLSGTSAASPATLILSSGTVTTPDYLSISNVRAYSLSSTWYAGANSTNLGSLGWIFAASGGVTYNSTITESATSTDAVTVVASVFNAVLAETATASDTITVSAAFNSSLSETATITDLVLAGIAYPASIAETATGTDAVSSLMAFASSVAESSTATDAASALAAFASSIAETSTSTDTISALGSFGSVVSETATATDSSVGYITFPASIDETLTSTDAVVGYITFPADIAESLSASDLTSSVFAFSAFVSETVTSTDSADTTAIFISSVSETSTSTDTITANGSFGSAVLESATLTDTTSAAATFAPAVTETATGTDSVSVLASFASVVAESGTATDATVGYITFPASIAETGTATDSTSSVPIYLTTILESATATDATSSLAAFGGIILESATATDEVSAPGSTYNPSIIETSTASDATVGYILFPATVVESATSTDQADAFTVFVSSVSESATGTDAVSAAQGFNSIIEEIGTAADSITVAPSIFNAPVVELVTGTDATRGTAVFPNYITETISITDLVIGAYLWNPINDDQTANWAPVNDSQTVTWTAVNDSQTVSWQNVDNSQSSGWVDVDDQQTPVWTPILP